MSLELELQKLSPSALVELFEIDLDPDNPGSVQKVYFHAGTNNLTKKIVWQGIEYHPFPIAAQGFDKQATGAMPRVTLRVANADGAFSSIIQDMDSLLRCRLTRRRTFARFLDAINFPEGNPTASPTTYLPSDIFYMERKVSESVTGIELEFASRFDVEGVMLPRRQITSNCCSWTYRGADCGYVGKPVATITDLLITPTATGSFPFPEYNSSTSYTAGQSVWYGTPRNVYAAIAPSTGITPGTDTSKWVLDVCGKRITSCKLRHGAHPGATLPYGAFPGSTRGDY